MIHIDLLRRAHAQCLPGPLGHSRRPRAGCSRGAGQAPTSGVGTVALLDWSTPRAARGQGEVPGSSLALGSATGHSCLLLLTTGQKKPPQETEATGEGSLVLCLALSGSGCLGHLGGMGPPRRQGSSPELLTWDLGLSQFGPMVCPLGPDLTPAALVTLGAFSLPITCFFFFF